jgi:hypothetical protein
MPNRRGDRCSTYDRDRSEFRREPLRAGAVGGYRGGFKRKRALLARERAPSGVR